MSTVSRYRFMGSWLYFWLLCITGIGLPIAVLYLITGTIRVEERVADADRLLDALAAGRKARAY